MISLLSISTLIKLFSVLHAAALFFSRRRLTVKKRLLT
jgi:hypothetical protein